MYADEIYSTEFSVVHQVYGLFINKGICIKGQMRAYEYSHADYKPRGLLERKCTSTDLLIKD